MRILIITCLLSFTIWTSAFGQALPSPSTASPVPTATSSPTCADGELLIKWRGGPLSDAAAEGNARCGAHVRRNFCECGWQWVCLAPGMTVSRGMELYRNEPNVLAAEPNYVGHLDATPNDTLYGSQWYLPKISAPAAWDVTKGSTNVVVAVIDTGAEYTHPDLAGNIWHNPGEIPGNGIDDDANGYVDDVIGIDAWGHTSDPLDLPIQSSPGVDFSSHGSFVAGLIGAVGNNGTGITGLNWSVEIMPLRYLGGIWSEERPGAWIAAMLECFDYVIKMKRRGTNIRVINVSSGIFLYSQALADAIEVAGSEGILTSCSAGNASYDTDTATQFPSGYDSPYVLSVAATDSADQLSGFSNFGKSTVDLAAPGESMFSTSLTNSYKSWSGTSFSAPLVSGSVALLAAARPTASWQEIKTAILQSVDPLPSLKNRVATGGRLNVARALQVLTNTDLPPIVLGAFPGNALAPADAPIEIYFNQPMDQASVESALILTPPVDGSFSWSDDGRVCRLTPSAPFVRTNYSARLLSTAQSQSGLTLDGNFNRVGDGTPADDFVWGFQLPLANDYFTNAQSLSGNVGTVTATTKGASYEADEPDHASNHYMVSSVWYQWTPETSGWVTFSILSNSFDTLLAAYTGSRLDSLIQVAASDDDGAKTGGRISFSAEAGTHYSIAVAGKAANSARNSIGDFSMGTFTLNWAPPPAPTMASFSPANGYIGSRVTVSGTNLIGATAILFNGVSSPVIDGSANNADFQAVAVIPPGATTGPITVVTPHGNVTSTTSLTVFLNPKMAIRNVPGTNLLEISWSNSPGFNLQRASGPSSRDVWSSTTFFSARLTNGIRSVSVRLDATNSFYRLVRP